MRLALAKRCRRQLSSPTALSPSPSAIQPIPTLPVSRIVDGALVLLLVFGLATSASADCKVGKRIFLGTLSVDDDPRQNSQ